MSEEPRRIDLAARRRAPRFRAFLLTGAVAGVVLGLLVALIAPGGEDSAFAGRTVAGFLAMAMGLLGALAGGVVAVVVDRRSTRGRDA